MKTKILKSAKGNEQKQNKPAKPQIPNPQNPKTQAVPHTKKRQSKGKESNPKIGLHTLKNRKQPSTFKYICI